MGSDCFSSGVCIFVTFTTLFQTFFLCFSVCTVKKGKVKTKNMSNALFNFYMMPIALHSTSLDKGLITGKPTGWHSLNRQIEAPKRD